MKPTFGLIFVNMYIYVLQWENELEGRVGKQNCSAVFLVEELKAN